MTLDDKKVIFLIAEKEMTLKDLCESAGLSTNSFRNIRQGKSRPRPATLGKIAKALGVSVKDIIQDGDAE